MTADMMRLNLRFRRQLGLVTRAQCMLCGLTDGQITHRLRNGTWFEIRPGVYALAGAPPSWEQSLLAVTLASPESIASHATAARLWRLRGFVDPPTCIEVVRPMGTLVRLDGVRGHRSQYLFDSDRSRRSGIPTVTASRAIVDLSASIAPPELGRLLDDAIRRRLATLEEFRRCAERLAPAPGRSIRKVNLVLANRLPGYSPGDSDLETRALRALTRAGLPPPRQQYRMILAGRKVRIDLAYPEHRIAIELDGWEYHGSRSAFDADRCRSDDLLVARWAPVRFTSTMTDEYFVSVVSALFEASSGQPSARSGAA